MPGIVNPLLANLHGLAGLPAGIPAMGIGAGMGIGQMNAFLATLQQNVAAAALKQVQVTPAYESDRRFSINHTCPIAQLLAACIPLCMAWSEKSRSVVYVVTFVVICASCSLQMQDAKSQPLMLPPKPAEDVVFREIIINDADPGTRYRLTKRGVQEEVLRNSQSAAAVCFARHASDSSPSLHLHLHARELTLTPLS